MQKYELIPNPVVAVCLISFSLSIIGTTFYYKYFQVSISLIIFATKIS